MDKLKTFAPLVGLFALFLTVLVLYSNLCADIRTNTEYREWSIQYFDAKLESITWRLEQIEAKVDKILHSGYEK